MPDRPEVLVLPEWLYDFMTARGDDMRSYVRRQAVLKLSQNRQKRLLKLKK